jgi:hypothetical protein
LSEARGACAFRCIGPRRASPSTRTEIAGDDATARLAASIRADEERMLARVLEEIPKLIDAVVVERELASA